MDKSFEKGMNSYKEQYISPKSKVLQSSQNPEFSSYSPDFRFDTSPSPLQDLKSSSILEDKKTNSKAVANCIRALTEKAAVLDKENQQLKRQIIVERERAQKDKEETIRQLEDSQQQLEANKKKIFDYEDEFKRCGRRILLLEDQNRQISAELDRVKQESNVLKTDLDYESSKTQKLENTINKIKTEVKETEEHTSGFEVEKNQLKSELEEAQKFITQLQRELSSSRGSDKQKQNRALYESHKVREMEYKNKFLQDLADTQQKEIEQLRREIEILRSTINQLEESKDVLIEQNRQNEQYFRELTEKREHRKTKKKSEDYSTKPPKKSHTHSHHTKKPSIQERILDKEVEEIDNRYKSLMNSGRLMKSDLDQDSFARSSVLNSYKPFN